MVSYSLLIQKINLQVCSDLAVYCAILKWIVSNLKISPVIWKNLVRQVLMKIELDPYLNLLSFSPSIDQSRTCKTLLFRHFFIWKNLVCQVYRCILIRKNLASRFATFFQIFFEYFIFTWLNYLIYYVLQDSPITFALH